MDKRFNLNDIPNKIFTESSLYTSECESLSSDNESLDIAIDGARNVIKSLSHIDDPGIIDEMKIMIKDTEKNISKNILLELYSFKTHFDGIKDGAHGDFMACKYTNLNKCVPTLKPLLNLLTEVDTRLSKFHNHFTPDAKDAYKDTIDDLYDMVRDKYEGIYCSVLGEEAEIDKTDFMEKMFLTFRNGTDYTTEQYSADDLDEYENKVHECYLGIGDSVGEYNEDMIKCMKIFDHIEHILKHDMDDDKESLLKMISLYTLRYMFIANIAYAGKADAVKSYLRPTNNDIECGGYVRNDDPIDIDDFEDIDDDEDDDEFDWGLLDSDEAVVESAFDTIDIQENYVPEYVDSPKLYVMEAQIMSILNEELMTLHEAPRWNQIRKAANAKQQAKNIGSTGGKTAGQIKDETIAKWEKEATEKWKNWKPEQGQSKTWENFKKSGQYQKVWIVL